MTCRELIDFLDAYLNGELPAAELAEFERHLAICVDCEQYLASYRQTVELERKALRDERAVDEQVPAGLIEAILAARAAEQRKARG